MFRPKLHPIFEYRLAMDLGMTVGMLRATMGQREFVRWKVFYDLRDRATAEAVEASASKQQ